MKQMLESARPCRFIDSRPLSSISRPVVLPYELQTCLGRMTLRMLFTESFDYRGALQMRH